jgi:hypothetical protein
MIELQDDVLVFRFPEVHENAVLRIRFLRTLRVPDDRTGYPLAPSFGYFPVQHVDDFAGQVPDSWIRHGGVMMPMHQSEALSLQFEGYPCAVKVAAGKINAVTGEPWREGVHRDPQDYLIPPTQRSLDGFYAARGVVRQFVATLLGAGYTAEEQVTGAAEWGGLQISVLPMRPDAYERLLEEERRQWEEGEDQIMGVCCEAPPPWFKAPPQPPSIMMGLALGGEVGQKIYLDTQALEDWDAGRSARCFVHIANALQWRQITGAEPPCVPPSAADYTRLGLPWFQVYDEPRTAVEGSAILAGLESVARLGEEKDDTPLPENDSAGPMRVVRLRDGMREGGERQGVVDW